MVGSDGNHEIAASPDSMQKALVESWKPVYSEKVIDQPAAERLLLTYISRNSHLLTFENIPPPSEHQFQEAIRRSKNSAP